jgi:single-stranded-DNA-specific exonuclease
MSPPARVLWIPPVEEPSNEADVARLAAGLSLPRPLARLLIRRGFGDVAAAQDFLDPRLQRLADPFALPDMAAAVARIFGAIDRREPITLYGDYDVDGVTSLTLLAEVLAGYGVTPSCFLPHRMDEGYGLSADGVARCVAEHQPKLLIAVDCGTVSADEIASLKASGVDTIVLDHHEPGAVRPDCVALVNPKCDPDGACKYLCSAGIVFKTCHALLKTRPQPGYDLKSALDLVALGTVADLVPLKGENRVLVRRGLVELARTPRPGLRALMDVSGLGRGTMRPGDVGFRLGPRLNAAGRLGTAQAALELLQTRDSRRARELADELHQQNAERQEVERRTLADAEKILHAGSVAVANLAAIVVAGRGWHPGVLGIVAARLLRTYHRPTLVVGFDESGVGKGSGRSIEGLALVEALRACDQWLDRFGGHEMAAGLTIREANFAGFQFAFQEFAKSRLSPEQLQPKLRFDAEVTLDELDDHFWEQIARFQPFGMGNPDPLFLARGVMPAGPARTMKEKHLRLSLRQPNRPGHSPHAGIFFNGASPPPPPPPWDVAFHLDENEWNGETRRQLRIEALRSSE